MQIVTKSTRPIGMPYLIHPDVPTLLFWQMVQSYAHSALEHPGAKHSGVVCDQNLKLSYSLNAIVYCCWYQ